MTRSELNVAFKGAHYCRVIIPQGSEIRSRALSIARIIKAGADVVGMDPNGFKFRLTDWQETGHAIPLSI